MYYYIVDPQKLSQKEFERVQNVLYSSLSEYRISGEIVRITGLRTVQQLVENAFAHEAKTIVAVGSDETLYEVINALNKREMVVGYIPLVDSEFAQTIGIRDLEQAIKTIAFRRIEEIDLGIVNNTFFLTKLNFGAVGKNQPMDIKFKADDKYQATQSVISGLIINSRIDADQKTIGNPTDGLLDVLLLPKLTTWETLWRKRSLNSGFYEKIPQTSVLHVTNIEIMEPTGVPLMSAGKVIARTPAKIYAVPKMLRMIVGRERAF